MHKKGFALLEIAIVIGIIAVVVGGGVYFKSVEDQSGKLAPGGQNVVNQAENAAQEAASATIAEQNALNAVNPTGGSGAVASAGASASTSVKSSAAAADPLAGLGSDKYANGILPLGDSKYVTSGPKKGYVYVCNANMNGGGAQTNGSWISGSSWNINEKTAVEGSVNWPNASYSMSVKGSTRTIVTNGLPTGEITGIFPIPSTDPAYQIDRNPNSIKTQSLTFSLPVSPSFAAAPSCIGGEVGVMTDGVVLFDAFDAELRDAVAHEMQDACDGHPQESGEYHYHGPSVCLPNGSTTVIGFAFDGFPITGAKIADHRYLTTSDLDECHGITSPIVLDGKKITMYHYVMTEDFPYSVSCFRGTSTVKGPTAGTAAQQGGTPPQGGMPPPPMPPSYY